MPLTWHSLPQEQGCREKTSPVLRAPQRYLVCVNTGHEKSHSFAKPVVFLDFQTHLQVAKFFFLFLCFATAAALTTPALCTALLGSHNVSVFTLLGERRSFLKRIYQIRISCVHPTAAGGQQNRGAAHVPWAFRAAVPLTSRKNARSSSSRWGTPQNRYERNIEEEKKKKKNLSPRISVCFDAGTEERPARRLHSLRNPSCERGLHTATQGEIPRQTEGFRASSLRSPPRGRGAMLRVGALPLPRRLADKERSAAAGRGAPTRGTFPLPAAGGRRDAFPAPRGDKEGLRAAGPGPPRSAPSPRRPRAGRRERKGRGRPQGDTRRRRPASRAPLTWHLQTMSASCASRSTTLPLPSSPHWAPSTTVTLLPGRRAAHPPLGMAGAGAPCSAMARAARSGASPGTCGSARRPRCPRLLPAGRGCRIQVVVPPTGTARPSGSGPPRGNPRPLPPLSTRSSPLRRSLAPRGADYATHRAPRSPPGGLPRGAWRGACWGA